MTVALVSAGVATEANPIMRAFLDAGGVPMFAVVKMSLVTAGLAFLWSIRDRLVARAGIVTSLLCYCYVASIHLSIISSIR